jgi:hypothetical protein
MSFKYVSKSGSGSKLWQSAKGIMPSRSLSRIPDSINHSKIYRRVTGWMHFTDPKIIEELHLHLNTSPLLAGSTVSLLDGTMGNQTLLNKRYSLTATWISFKRIEAMPLFLRWVTSISSQIHPCALGSKSTTFPSP